MIGLNTYVGRIWAGMECSVRMMYTYVIVT